MILQFISFQEIMDYLPTCIYLCFDITIFIFGYLIYKKKSSNSGLFLMISAIFSSTPRIIFLAINTPYLAYNLWEIGFTMEMISNVFMFINILFLGLNIVSLAFLLLVIYKIYNNRI